MGKGEKRANSLWIIRRLTYEDEATQRTQKRSSVIVPKVLKITRGLKYARIMEKTKVPIAREAPKTADELG